MKSSDHLAAIREAIQRVLGEGTGDDGHVVRRQRVKARPGIDVLYRKLGGRHSRKRQDAGKHFLIDDCQAVLIAVRGGTAVEDLRRGVDRGHAAHHGVSAVLDLFDQAEIGDFYAAADNQQILGLNIEVLKRVLAEVIERIGGVTYVAEQLGARWPGRFSDRPETGP